MSNVAQPIQTPVSTQPGIVSMGQAGLLGSQVTFLNLDPTNTITLGYTNTITVGGQNAIPLGPNATVTIDGTKTVWACAPVGTQPLTIIPGSIQYTPGSPLVMPIAKLGSLSVNAFTIPAASVVTPVQLFDMSAYTSYDISTFCFCATQSTAGSPICVPITFVWYDDLTSGVPVYKETWDIWVSDTAVDAQNDNAVVYGSGPVHGRYLTVQYAEVQGANSYTCLFLNLFGSSKRAITPQSVWKQKPPANINFGVGQFTDNFAATYDDVLTSIGWSLPTGNTAWLPIGLYSGPVSWWFNSSAALSNSAGIIAAVPEVYSSGGVPIGISGAVGLIVEINAATSESGNAYLPRCPTFIVLRNATGATVSGLFTVVGIN